MLGSRPPPRASGCGHIAGAPCGDSDEEDRIEGRGAGLSAQEIGRSTALSKTDYDFGATADPPYPASRGADMGAKVNKVSSGLVLTRTLGAFANELIDASDEEILEVLPDGSWPIFSLWKCHGSTNSPRAGCLTARRHSRRKQHAAAPSGCSRQPKGNLPAASEFLRHLAALPSEISSSSFRSSETGAVPAAALNRNACMLDLWQSTLRKRTPRHHPKMPPALPARSLAIPLHSRIVCYPQCSGGRAGPCRAGRVVDVH